MMCAPQAFPVERSSRAEASPGGSASRVHSVQARAHPGEANLRGSRRRNRCEREIRDGCARESVRPHPRGSGARVGTDGRRLGRSETARARHGARTEKVVLVTQANAARLRGRGRECRSRQRRQRRSRPGELGANTLTSSARRPAEVGVLRESAGPSRKVRRESEPASRFRSTGADSIEKNWVAEVGQEVLGAPRVREP